MRRLLWLVPVALMLVVGCTADRNAAQPAPTTQRTPAVQQAAATSIDSAMAFARRGGCSNPSLFMDEPRAFVFLSVDCMDSAWSRGGEHTSFNSFTDDEGVNGWVRLVRSSGNAGVVLGQHWAVDIPDELPDLDVLVSLLIERLGGKRIS